MDKKAMKPSIEWVDLDDDFEEEIIDKKHIKKDNPDDYDQDYYDDYEDDYEDDYDDDEHDEEYDDRYDDEYDEDYDNHYDDEYDEEYDDRYDDEYDDDYDDYDEYYEKKSKSKVVGKPSLKGKSSAKNKKSSKKSTKKPAKKRQTSSDNAFVAIWHRIQDWFYERTVVDYLMIGFGAIALIAFVTVGAIFFSSQIAGNSALNEFSEIGSQMEGISVVGETGLLAVANARDLEYQAVLEAIWEAEEQAELEAQLPPEEEETTQEAKKAAIVMNLTSIQKDLKIKFINNSTQKLMKGIPFEVTITDPSGKTSNKTNNDKDGIIYLKNIAPGNYKVALVGPESEEYTFLSDPVSIKVKDAIEYKKVDVSDEIKTEKEINAAQEDTKKNVTAQEGALQDTVEWVESTKTLIEGTGSSEEKYEEVKLDNISDPAKTSYLGMKLLSRRFEPDNEGETPTPAPEETQAPEETPTPTPEETPTPTPEETPTPTAAPTATPTNSPSPSPAPTPSSSSSASPSASPSTSPSTSPSASPSASPSSSPSPEVQKAMNDKTSVLKTTGGDALYIKDGDKYVEAKYADYYKKDVKFYKKTVKTTGGTYKYTGWQTIDGYTYFFNKDGNYVTGEQVIQGAKYVFGQDGKLSSGSGVLGIDISKWNSTIDFNAVKNSGVNFVIIRCGYRGSTVGALVEDTMFRTNIKGATNAGLKVGVYFFSQAINEVEAVEEASTVLSLVKGYNLAYPVFLDMEPSGGRADGLSVAERTKVAQAFCKTIANSGYKAGVYANKTWLNEKLDAPGISNYKIWLAQYNSTPTYTRTRYDLWQYSSKGTVAGIKGNVDMNISYMGY